MPVLLKQKQVLQGVPKKKEEHLELVFGDVDRKVTVRHRNHSE